MKIKVTQTHIENGVQGACSRCPVALAAADVTTLGPNEFISVAPTYIVEDAPYSLIILDGFRPVHTTPLPDQVGSWIDHFDLTGQGEPFEFEVDFA